MKAGRDRPSSEQAGIGGRQGNAPRLTRRDFMKLTGATIAAVSFGGCKPRELPGPTPTSPATDVPPASPTPAPRDVPIFRTSFEGMVEVPARGLNPTTVVELTSENLDYAGGPAALHVTGTLPGDKATGLGVDFSTRKLTGEDSLDLTDKTLYFSALIPTDSPVDNISAYAGKGGRFVFLAGINADAYWNKGAWHTYHFELSFVPNLMRDCDTIRIAGHRLVDGDPVLADFLIDDLRWIRSDSLNLPLDDSIDSLRKYAAGRHFRLGLFSALDLIFGSPDDAYINSAGNTKDPWYGYAVAQEGTVNVLEDFSEVRQGEDYGQFEFDPAQGGRLIRQHEFGQAYGMTTLGYGLGCLYYTAPQWVQDLPFPDATKALLLHHVEEELRYTKAQNPIWILFNEFIQSIEYGNAGLRNRRNPTGMNPWGGTHWDYSPWAADTADASLIKAAFVKAREVDPGAVLLLNEFEAEEIGARRSDFLYSFVSGLKDEAVPIDGVGWQMHNFIDPDGRLFLLRELVPHTYQSAEKVDLDAYLQNVDQNVKRYATRGLKVAFTEVECQIRIDDVDVSTPAGRAAYEERLQWQAAYFAGLLKIALHNQNVILFHMWGGTDEHQNVQPWPGYGNGFIFDKHYDPKPAYHAMLDLLKSN